VNNKERYLGEVNTAHALHLTLYASFFSDHAVIMSKFASESMKRMKELVKRLEVSLGPDTGELCMRCGLHSGPITAGVLRGEKSRFQLFGDTVNFASRMESTGQPNRIQCSQTTAELLRVSGKHHWLVPRDNLVVVKGKGTLKTFFITVQPKQTNGKHESPKKKTSVVHLKSRFKQRCSNHDSFGIYGRRGSQSDHNQTLTSSHSSPRRCLLTSQHESQIWQNSDNLDVDDDYDGFEDSCRQERLIEWNIEILADLLRRIVGHRQTNNVKASHFQKDFIMYYQDGQNALDEITEIICLGGPTAAQQDLGASSYWDIDPTAVMLPKEVEKQLRVGEIGQTRDFYCVNLISSVVQQNYVSMIACMYRDNPFHNFEVWYS
jgi:hypothetical protein